MDSPTAAHVDALKRASGLLRETIPMLVPSSDVSHREVALRRWGILLATLTCDLAGALCRLVPTNDVRAGLVLARSIYEYNIKMRYFFQHPAAAKDQYATLIARHYRQISKLPSVDPEADSVLAAEYLKWKRTAGDKTEYSGNRTLSKMAIDLAMPEERLQDQSGIEYTQDFVTGYGIPSMYVHCEAPLIRDLFPAWEDDKDWTISPVPLLTPNFLTITRVCAGVILVSALVMRKHVGTDLDPLRDAMRVAMTLNEHFRIVDDK
jgi:hypothetical protein